MLDSICSEVKIFFYDGIWQHILSKGLGAYHSIVIVDHPRASSQERLRTWRYWLPSSLIVPFLSQECSNGNEDMETGQRHSQISEMWLYPSRSPSLSISWSFLVTFPVAVFFADSHQVPLHDLSSQIHVPATSRVYCPGSGVGDDHDGVILYNPSVYGGEWLISIGFEPVRMMENCNISGLVIRVR